MSGFLVDLPLGRYALDIQAQGFGREHLEEIDLGPGSEEAQIEIALTIPCSIHGRVRDLSGRPVEGCELSVYLRSSASEAGWRRMFHESALSDVGGEFRMDALPFGAYYSVARKEGFQTKVGSLAPSLVLDPENLSFDTGKSLEVLVLAYRARGLEGTVTCRGQPVAGATIRLRRKEEDKEIEGVFFRGAEEKRADGTGAYQIADYVPGIYEVEVRGPGAAKLLESLEVPEPRDGEGALRKDFQLEPGGAVRGWLVRNGQGSPGWVHLFQRIDPEKVEFKGSVRAAPDGLFSFPDRLADGSYLLCGFADGHPAGGFDISRKIFKTQALPGEVAVRVENGAGPQEILVESVPGDCGVSGRVMDRSGRPIPGASFHIKFNSSGLQTYGAARASDAGEFAFIDLSPGSLQLQVDAEAFATTLAEAILSEPGEIARLEVVMESARTFRARIEYADGEPDSNLEIVLERKTDRGWRHERGGRPGVGIDGGMFEAGNLPPGIYRASATFRDHAESWSPDADLRELESAEVVLRAEAGAVVSGKISFADPDLGKGRVLAQLHYSDGVRAVKPMRIGGSIYRIEHLRRGRLAEIVLQCASKADVQEDELLKWILSEPLPGFVVDKDENVFDLGPVRKRINEK